MKYISVCSGIEAATSAWHHMGWEPVAFSEIEPFPSAVLAHHYPTVPNWGDMTKFQEWPDACICGKLSCNHIGGSGSSNDNSGIQPNAKRGRPVFGINSKKGICNECNGTIVDVLVGGTPCQSFSVAGLRKGLADPRGNLMLTFGAIAQRYRPKWLVWENVPGVLSSNGGRDFGAFLGMLGQLGYGFSYRVLDAQFFGVAQRRRRVFVVGCLGDWRRAAAVLFERHSLSGHPAPSRKARKDTAGSTGDGIARCITTREMSRQDWETCTMVAQPITHALRGEGFDASEDGTGRGTPLVPVAVGTDCYNGAITGDIAATLGTPGSSVNASGPTVMQPSVAVAFALPALFIQDDTTPKVNEERAGCLRRDAGGEGACVMTPIMQVRRLTPAECERLQGFPDGHTAIPWRNKPADQCPDGPRYKALGNSMAVPVMRWIGERIAAVDQVATPGLPAASAASAT